MNTKRITGISCFLLLLLLASLSAVRHQQKPDPADRLRLEIFPSGQGWGYQICTDDKVVIKQPHIPGLPTICPFVTEQDARTIGTVVLSRIHHRQNFTVTAEDLKQHHIQ